MVQKISMLTDNEREAAPPSCCLWYCPEEANGKKDKREEALQAFHLWARGNVAEAFSLLLLSWFLFPAVFLYNFSIETGYFQ